MFVFQLSSEYDSLLDAVDEASSGPPQYLHFKVGIKGIFRSLLPLFKHPAISNYFLGSQQLQHNLACQSVGNRLRDVYISFK